MGTFPQVTSGTESSSGLHEWTGWLQSVSLSTMQVCELLVCINRQVWVEGMGQSMNCVRIPWISWGWTSAGGARYLD